MRCPTCGSNKCTSVVGEMDFDENGWFSLVEWSCPKGHKWKERRSQPKQL